jgi:predicted transposase/invertase (TIGR01784 family)
MLFVQYPGLLKRLVAELLEISLDSIEQFVITNPEIPPDTLGDKFCRLDINMVLNKQRIDLEIQVRDEKDFPERSLYYWAREYSSALGEGGDYAELPRVVIISILAYNLFECAELHSEFQALEVKRLTSLTDRLSLHYFELQKLAKELSELSRRELWLALFNAKTEEELEKIEALGVPEMTQAIEAYRRVTVTDEFQEAERLRLRARSNEAAALRHAKTEGANEERAKWEDVVADKDALIAELRARLDGGK